LAHPAAGGVFVPLNPLLKAEQVGYILRDCNVRVLVTSPERLALLQETLPACHDLRHVVVLDSANRCRLSMVPINYSLERLTRRLQCPGIGLSTRTSSEFFTPRAALASPRA
jgi:acyl-CoA synthetase (AMP-forming)/AMP-acid ligase II